MFMSWKPGGNTAAEQLQEVHLGSTPTNHRWKCLAHARPTFASKRRDAG